MMSLPSFQSAFAKCQISDAAFIHQQGLKTSVATTTTTTGIEWNQVLPPTPPATPPSDPDFLTCHFCNKTYTSRSKLSEHLNHRHSEARPHACSQCPKVFKSASNLKQHVKCAHERPRYACPDCPRSSRVFSESGLRYHRLTAHSDCSSRPSHACHICAKNFVLATLLRKHVASAHVGERKFFCPYCPAAFKRKDHADRHVTDTHSLVAELFECEVCGGRFQSASRLKQHAKLHHDVSMRRPCDLCGKTMLAKNLVTHYQRAHSGLQPRRKKCHQS